MQIDEFRAPTSCIGSLPGRSHSSNHHHHHRKSNEVDDGKLHGRRVQKEKLYPGAVLRCDQAGCAILIIVVVVLSGEDHDSRTGTWACFPRTAPGRDWK